MESAIFILVKHIKYSKASVTQQQLIHLYLWRREEYNNKRKPLLEEEKIEDIVGVSYFKSNIPAN